MAATVIGSIARVEGTLILLKTSGEQRELRPDDVIVSGDILYVSGDGEATVQFTDVSSSSIRGFGVIKAGDVIVFDESTLVDLDRLLVNTNIENPVALDFQSPLEVLSLLNELPPAAAGPNTETAEEQSRSQTVIDTPLFTLRNNFPEALPSANATDSSTGNSSALFIDESLSTSSTDINGVINETTNQAIVDRPTIITGGSDGFGDEDDSQISGILTATDENGLSDGTVFSVTATPGNGAAIIDSATGAWSYTPSPNFNGLDVFTVTITDDLGNATNQVVSVTVNPIDDPSIISGDITGNGAEDGGAITGALTASDSDGLADGSVFTVSGGATNGIATIDPATGTWSYTPSVNFHGIDNFTVTVTDDAGNTRDQIITTTVTPVSDPTIIGGDISGSGDEDDSSITGTLTATDGDGLTDGTVFTVSGGATNGTAIIDPATGVWSYTPNADFNGNDTFTVTITDDTGSTTTQGISLTVNAVNDPTLISLTPTVDMGALNGFTPTIASSVTATTADLDAYSTTLPHTFYFDVTVDTSVVGDQVLFESGGATFGIAIFQQQSRLGVSIGEGNNIDLISSDVLTDSTRYGIVVELAAGNQLNVYLGELDGSGVPQTSVTLIASTVWSGSSDWTGTDDGGWGVLNGAQQGATALSFTDFAGAWHDGRFYADEATPHSPVLASSNGATVVYEEGDSAKVVSANISLTDIDDTALESATVSISAGFVSGEDVLVFSNTGNITGNYNAATGVLTLNGSDTLANYEAALESIAYNNASDSPSTADRIISWVVNDGSHHSATVTSTIEVTAVNDIPTLGITTGIDLDAIKLLTPTESASVIGTDTTLDGYSSNVPDFFYFDAVVDTGASGNQVWFESGGSGTGIVIFQNGTDLLVAIGNDNNVDLTVSNVLVDATRYGLVVELAANNQLTLYLGELDNLGQLTGTMNSIATTTWTGSADWSGSDGSGWGIVSNSAQSSATVAYTGFAGTWNSGQFYSNQSPPTTSLEYTENDGAQVINSNITLDDVDNTHIESATITISSGFESTEDVLAFVSANGISGNYNAITGILTLTGSATLAHYQAALRSVTYSNTANPPVHAERTVDWVINDGSDNSLTASSAISVTPFTEPPEISNVGGILAYSEGDGAQIIDASLTVSDLDDANIESAIIRISSGFVSTEDTLSFSSIGNITGSYNSTTGILTLSGVDTLANYETALESVTYENSNTTNPSPVDRTISWTINDGTVNSATVTSTVTVSPVNDAAQLSLSAAVDFTALTALTPTLMSATVQQQSSLNTYASTAPDFFYFDVTVDTSVVGNQLLFETGGTGTGLAVFQQGSHLVVSLGDGNDIDVEVDNILSNNTRYGIVVELVENNSLNIYVGELDGTGTPVGDIALVATTVWGGANWSGSNSAGWGEEGGGSVQGSSVLTPIDFAGTWHNGKFYSGESVPITITANGDTLDYTEGSGAQTLNRGASITDGDDSHIESATISIVGGFVTGQDVLAFTDTANITGSYNAASGVLTLTGSDTLANYASALTAITYENTSNNPNTGNRTISWLVNDGDGNSAAVTSTVTIAAVNDAPTLSLSFFDPNAVDISAINALTPTAQSSAIATHSGLQSYAADAPDFFYFDVTVDTANAGSQLIYETGGTGTGLAFFQQGADLLVSVGDGNDIDLTVGNVLSDNTRYGLVLELAAGNEVNVYLGELDGSGAPVSSITLIGTAAWSGSNWSGGNAGGWGSLSGSVQGQALTSYEAFSGAWHDGRFYSGASVPIGFTSNSGGTLAYTEGDGAQVIDAEVIAADGDNAQLQSATISITDGFVDTEDVLGFVNANGISGNYDAVTGVLTLTGSASLAHYETALESVTYTNTSSDPSTGDRTISWTLNDGATDSVVVTSTVEVTSMQTGDALPNVLTGSSGSDNIFGLAGADTLSGNAGQDNIYGGQGADNLYGNASGAGDDGQTDTFFWQLNDQGAGLNGSNVEQDIVFDLSVVAVSSGGDSLHLSDLLIGENAGTIANYLSLSDNGTDTTLSIDVAGDGSGVDLTILLSDVTGVTLSTLINNGNVVFDN
ncbi:hypothetical protein IMCC1989_1065 [gamma proteobacterium IMCC1989]|nr:hypothetical protein IMCC1989_1065 [gamma proteobacterium IMCC1989]